MNRLLRRAGQRLQQAGILPLAVNGIHETLDDWLATQSSAREKHWKRILEPAKLFPKIHPEVVISDTNTAFDPAADDHGDTYQEGEKFVVQIGGGIVGSDNYELLTPDRWLIRELLINDTVLKNKFVRSTQLLWPPQITQNLGHYATIYGVYIRTNYSHFVLDTLQRIQYLEAGGILPKAQIIVPGNMPRYQSDLLHLMGYDKSHWQITNGEYAAYEHLYTASFPQDCYWYPNPDACRQLKARLLAAVIPSTPSPSRIFITRKDSPFRRILNDNLVSCLIDHYGFVEIAAEKLSVTEQINLFRNAEIVVSSHGAGLTNILYMPEGSIVVELVGSWHRLPMYVNLAGGLGVRYAYVTTSSEYEQLHKNDDYIMPVERVLAAFDQLKLSPI